MGTTQTPNLNLIKFDDNEPLDNEQLNENSDKIDKGFLDVHVKGIPEGKVPKFYYGLHSITKGAGGEKRETVLATDGNGKGGVWLGYDGIPTFEGVVYADINSVHMSDEFSTEIVVQAMDTTKVSFRAKRQTPTNGFTWANGFSAMAIAVQIVGW